MSAGQESNESGCKEDDRTVDSIFMASNNSHGTIPEELSLLTG